LHCCRDSRNMGNCWDANMTILAYLQWILIALAINVAMDIIAIPATAVSYIVYTGLVRVQEEAGEPLPIVVKILASGILWIGIRTDIWMNYSLGPKVFWRFPPKEKWTLSKAMSEYWDTMPRDCRINKIVWWIKRETWIDKFDPSGQHIGKTP
jgi:hypothetical protein